MAQYIDKDTLVAEIERRKSQFMSQADHFHSLGMEEEREHFAVLASNMHSILSFIGTLEVKEVDLEKEINDYVNVHFSKCDDGVLLSDANSMELTLLDITPLARHFFELGLNAQKGE